MFLLFVQCRKLWASFHRLSVITNSFFMISKHNALSVSSWPVFPLVAVKAHRNTRVNFSTFTLGRL